MAATKSFWTRSLQLFSSWSFIKAFIVGLLSATLSVTLRYFDVDQGHNFLERYNPEPVVFNVFVVFASLVAAFRTSHALVRYVDAAALMHKQSSCWYDAGATLICFCRSSPAPKHEIKQFQQLTVRLLSLVSAFCLEGLEQKDDDDQPGHQFDIIGWDDLSEDLQSAIMGAHCKVEYVFTELEKLVCDAISSKVLTMAPPLMTRAFAELGQGLATYHEANKFSRVPLPHAYQVITRTILCAEAVFVPFMLAANTRGHVGAAIFTFGGTFLIWFIYSVSENLDNPFRKDANNLEVSVVQDELNRRLLQMIAGADSPTASLSRQFTATMMQSPEVSVAPIIVAKKNYQEKLRSSSNQGLAGIAAMPSHDLDREPSNAPSHGYSPAPERVQPPPGDEPLAIGVQEEEGPPPPGGGGLCCCPQPQDARHPTMYAGDPGGPGQLRAGGPNSGGAGGNGGMQGARGGGGMR